MPYKVGTNDGSELSCVRRYAAAGADLNPPHPAHPSPDTLCKQASDVPPVRATSAVKSDQLKSARTELCTPREQLLHTTKSVASLALLTSYQTTTRPKAWYNTAR
jgi:hypothetical protein